MSNPSPNNGRKERRKSSEIDWRKWKIKKGWVYDPNGNLWGQVVGVEPFRESTLDEPLSK